MRHEEALREEFTQGKDLNASSLLRHHLKIGWNLNEIQKKLFSYLLFLFFLSTFLPSHYILKFLLHKYKTYVLVGPF